MKQNIKAFARCRPLYDDECQTIVNLPASCDRVSILKRDGSGQEFYFDQVFPPSSQQVEVYDAVVRPMIEQVLMGINCTIFAYGRSGTGKTYTMVGLREDHGIIPRIVSHVLDEVRNCNSEFTLRVSFFGIYNEEIYDLLSPLLDDKKLKMIETDPWRGLVVVGNLKEIEINSADQIAGILKQASQKRQTIAKSHNSCSSRCHNIFIITIHVKDRGSQLVRIGKFNLVDLASCEDIGRPGGKNRRARETDNIDPSLLELRKVIEALVEKSPVTPYKQSTLTKIFQDSLGGTTSTSIIATVSPADEDLISTTSTLRYVSRSRSIYNMPEVNQQCTQAKSLAEYFKERKMLRDQCSSDIRNLVSRVKKKEALKYSEQMEKMRQSYKEKYEQECANLKATYESKLRSFIESRDKICMELQETREKYQSQLQKLSAAKEKLERDFKDQAEQLEVEKQNAMLSTNTSSSTLKSLMECCEESNLQLFREKVENLWRRLAGNSNLKPPVEEAARFKTKKTRKLNRNAEYSNQSPSSDSDKATQSSSMVGDW